MEDHSILDWISVLGPILFSWPLVIVIVLVFFYRPLFNLLEKFSSNNIQKAKIGPFEIEESEQAYVESLKLLLTSLVNDNEFDYLKQLNTDQGSVSYDGSNNLKAELERLSHLGFINAKTDLNQLPSAGELNHYIELTEKGKKYLTLRDNLVANQSSEQGQEE
ncbi:hypothetical protein IQ265_14685 [Nodosilinea sp. LEGE 06152]|uniref:hypothetical protein n=1 Tax=Nodosilinea sp. LEGE 06152 TaxID=2777966 RepID=UPI0018803BBF|nr:hypothetical protein [Nodosilinea sp. LEGE 06152]MBE9158063.1 hypothetical protein [Nodosilinea sp. LEGE 06152]